MNSISSTLCITALLMISTYIKLSESASIVPIEQERIMRQLASLEESEAKRSGQEHEIAEKRYSHAMYTSERGRGEDRAAVRRLLSMLVGKRSAEMTQEKRSGENLNAPPSTAFGDVHGYLLLVGKITDDIMDDVMNGEVVMAEVGGGSR
uniref:uncharacterized protein LOC120334221 n=1 Tax=Styela clava TaxID=7725 RepID=UPI001939797F|nr:uncharacterized protein LOC120334221 [Styela clava]